MAEYEIRPIEPADAEQIARLTAELGYEMTITATRKRIVSLDGDGVAFVAVDDGEIVGWIEGLNRELLIYPRILEVGGLVVAAEQRGRGIGTELLTTLEAWGAEHGHRLVFVRSSVVRDGAHRFYEGYGFRHEKTSYTFSLEIDRGRD